MCNVRHASLTILCFSNNRIQGEDLALVNVVVDLLFNLLPIVCGSSVFVFVLLCVTL